MAFFLLTLPYFLLHASQFEAIPWNIKDKKDGNHGQKRITYL
jgi:hypothetical protein